MVNSTKNVLGCTVAAAVCLLLFGCGDQGMPTTKVSGKISFDGGPPPTFGTIAFSLVPGTGAEGLPYRPGSSPFGKDGAFEVNSFGKGDGLLPGTYKVRITCLSGPPSSAPLEEISYVPLDWSPDDLVITGDQGSVSVEYDVPPKKPSR
jgi:hypothetical protein